MEEKTVFKKVLVVKEGKFEEEKYKSWLEVIKEMIEDIEKFGISGRKEKFKIEFAETASEAEERLAKSGPEEITHVIFISVVMIRQARKLREKFLRRIGGPEKVIVIPGIIPEEEIIIIDKSWVSHDLFRSMLTF